MYPALAIAHALKNAQPESEILFVGALGKIEMEKVPQHGFPIKGLWISGFQRGQIKRNLLFGVKLMWSLLHSLWILFRFRPQLAIGTGGFASGPMLWVAQLFGVKTILQEQNSYPGITNRFLAKRAKVVAVAYAGLEKYFSGTKLAFTGNPVRLSLLELPHATDELYNDFGLNPKRPVLLVLGGSLGALKINELMAAHYQAFLACGYQILWQCGRNYYEKYIALEGEAVKICDFIGEMDKAYALADVILSRAGAGTLSELSCVGRPTVLIPSTNVAEDHQLKNAKAFVDANAALLIEEAEADQLFEKELAGLLMDEDRKQKMARNIRQLAKPEATDSIVELIKNIVQ